MKWVAALGNAFDGHTIFGPFDSYTEADDWACLHHEGDGFFTVPMNEPAAMKED